MTVNGYSLLERTIRAAQNSVSIDHVVVTTDDLEIMSLSSSYGARVLRRPDYLSTDTASSESAVLHAINELGLIESGVEYIALLQCTSPFTTPDDINKVFNYLQLSGCSSAFSCVEWHGFLWDRSGHGINHNHLAPRARRQDLPPTLLETGAVYFFSAKEFMKTGSRFCMPTLPVKIDSFPLEVDDPLDLLTADTLSRSSLFKDWLSQELGSRDPA